MQFAENFSLSGRLADITEASPCVIYIFDIRERRNVFVNRGIAAMLGYSDETDVKKAEFIRSVMHPDDWQPWPIKKRQSSSTGCATAAASGVGFTAATRSLRGMKTERSGRPSAQRLILPSERIRKKRSGSWRI